MSRISVDAFLNGAQLICSENPSFKIGHDSSDGSCDGIGLLRGSLIRGGATHIKNMKELNQFARKTAQNLRKIDFTANRGSVLLKATDSDSMPLPSKYRQGGEDYNGDENNYIGIGILVMKNPCEIICMTNKGIVKSDSITEWDYACWLPYVMEEGENNPMVNATVCSETGKMKVYSKPSFANDGLIEEVENDTPVTVIATEGNWAEVRINGMEGYALVKFLKPSVEVAKSSMSKEEREELEKAFLIIGRILGHIK